jgi:hypothetical protein
MAMVDEKLAPDVGPYNFVSWQIFWGWTTFNYITFSRIQIYDHGRQLKVKIHFLFYGKNTWTVALKANEGFVNWKITDILTSFVWIIIFSNGVFEYGCTSKLWGYVGKNTELLCVEFCYFVQCHMFVSCLSCYWFIKGVLNIIHTNMVAVKCSRLYRPTNLFIFGICNMG